ncbi:MAG: hypothetical protein ACLGGV_03910 [Bacteroidia bacterium]
MKKLFFSLAFSASSLLVFSQNQYTPDYAQFLLEFEQGVSEKAMSKDWKKRKSAWETEVTNAKDLQQLNTLFSEFTSNLNPKVVNAQTLPKVELNEEYYYNGQAIASFANAFPKEQLNASFNLNEFNTSVKAKTSDIKEIEAKKAKDLEAKTVQTSFSDFQSTFNEVFIDSKKQSFFNTIEKKTGNNVYSVKTKMKAAGETFIDVSDENIYAYHSVVKVGSDIDLARDILNTLMRSIEKNLPGGYVMREWVEETYIDRVRFEYEFDHEEFRISAKQPTCYIAIIQKESDYYITWGVTEPVFKDWSKTNKDWLEKDKR